MSYERGMAALNLLKTDKIPHTEYISNDEFIKKITGIDTKDKNKQHLINPYLARKLDYDFIWSVCEMPLNKGRVTDMGHAVWDDVTGQSNKVDCPFQDEEDVLSFDPVEEYGISNKAEMLSFFNGYFNEQQEKYFDNCVFPGGRYHSIFSACIRTFGWEMFLASVTIDPKRFDNVLEGFYQITKSEIEAWAQTDIKVFNLHDDICWTSGAVFHPDWYRQYIFPRYKKLCNILKEAKIKIIYTADGNIDEFVRDIFETGFDGIVIEPSTNIIPILDEFGNEKVVIGNIDTRILQFGSKDDIYREVKRCSDYGKSCNGYFYAVGNHITNAVPLENIEAYFEYCEILGKR